MGLKRKSSYAAGECAWVKCEKKEGLKPFTHASKGAYELCAEHAVEAEAEIPSIDKAQVEAELATANLTLLDLNGFEATNEADLNLLATLLADVKGRNNRLEATKQAAIGPLNESLRNIRSWFAPAQNAYGEIETLIKKKISQYHVAVEAKRQAALATIEDSATSEEVGAALETLAEAQKPVVEGLTVSDVWTFEITDESILPRLYLTPNEKMIRVQISAGVRAIPGVRIFQTQRVSSRST